MLVSPLNVPRYRYSPSNSAFIALFHFFSPILPSFLLTHPLPSFGWSSSPNRGREIIEKKRQEEKKKNRKSINVEMIVCRGRLSVRNEAAIISLAIVRTDRSSWSPPFARRCHLLSLSLSLSLFSISLPTRCFVSRRCYEAANLLSVPSAKAVKLTHKTDRWTEILAWKGSTDRFAGLPCNRARADCSCSILRPFTSPRLEYDFASTRKPRRVHCQGYSRLVASSILARFPSHFTPPRSLFNLTAWCIQLAKDAIGNSKFTLEICY